MLWVFCSSSCFFYFFFFFFFFLLFFFFCYFYLYNILFSPLKFEEVEGEVCV
jgi:hypothetical protein